jgi:hypothetical protein
MDMITLALARKKAKNYTDSVALNGVPVSYPQVVGGKWQVYDPVAGAYSDTGVFARGTKLGVAANGNWQSSEDDGATWSDTGVQAQGPQGAAGAAGATGAQGTPGQDGADGADGETPLFRMSGNTLQYKYPSDSGWTDLFAFSGGGSGGGTVSNWGDIGGTLADQLDLAAALSAKQNALNAAQLAAANSGIDGTKVTALDSHLGEPLLHISTTARTAAVDSGVTSAKVSGYDAHVADGGIHVTAAQKTEWGAKYDKPATGIPSSDMSGAVQASLGRADSAYQKPTNGIPASDMAQSVQNTLALAAGHVPDTSNPHGVTLQQAATAQGTTAAILPVGLGVYAGSNATGNKLATISDVEGVAQGAAMAGGAPLAWGVDGTTVTKEDLKGAGATTAINYPYLVAVGDLVGDDAAAQTYEVTAIAADGTLTFAPYTQPTPD